MDESYSITATPTRERSSIVSDTGKTLQQQHLRAINVTFTVNALNEAGSQICTSGSDGFYSRSCNSKSDTSATASAFERRSNT